MWKACVLLAVIVVLLALAFQKTTVIVELSITIKSDPRTVFQLFSEPENLPQYHPYYVTVEGITETVLENLDGGKEHHYQFTIYEEPPVTFIFVETNFSVSFPMKYALQPSVDKNSFVVSAEFNVSYLLGFGIMHCKIVWTMSPTATGETLLTDTFRLHPPRIFRSFTESRARISHDVMLSNIKEAAEGINEN